MSVTYSSYLKVHDLLSLQEPKTPEEHDEMLFIIIHQVYELWFKQIHHELNFLETLLDDGNGPRSLATMKRVLTIFKTLVGQVDILETMTPMNFVSFRERLESSSGFQSWQFRMFEFKLGKKSEKMVEFFPSGSMERREIEQLMKAPTLWDHVLKYLAGIGQNVPKEILDRDFTQPYEPNEKIQDILVHVYRNDFSNAQFLERLVDFDEGVQEWRYRHVKMVERTIGSKTGTGGSAGAEYLKKTLFQPAFPDLWAIRSRL